MSVDRSAVIVRGFIIDENPYTDDRFADIGLSALILGTVPARLSLAIMSSEPVKRVCHLS